MEIEHNVIIQGDCLAVLQQLPDECADLIFADPPFNLGRNYGTDDDKRKNYKEWTLQWIELCVQKLKVGGVIVIHHIPKEAIWIANYLLEYQDMEFLQWVAWKTANMPISNRLLPEHFPFIIFSKGKRKTFHSWGDIVPHKLCKKCGEMIADWGGKKKYLKDGKRVSDVWLDIERIRHKKNKHRNHNELPMKVIERILKIYTNPGDVVIDPFFGTGTTGAACKGLNRHYIGIEIDPEWCKIAEDRIKGE